MSEVFPYLTLKYICELFFFCSQERYKHQSNILPNYVPLGQENFMP